MNTSLWSTIIHFFTNGAWSVRKVLLVVAGCIAGLVAVSVIIGLVTFILRIGAGYSATLEGYGGGYGESSTANYAVSRDMAYDSYGGGMGGGKLGGDSGYEMAKMAASGAPMPYMTSMSTMPPMPSVNGSRNAEKFERTGYNAHYETGRMSEVCDAIEALKPMAYVLFDSAYVGERNCNYVFRVESKKADEVVAKLKETNPKEWSVSIDTFAQQIENTGDYVATLQRRLDSIKETMKESEVAFARLTTLATQGGKVENLTTIITQKLAMVERLTNERLSLEEQIKQVTNNKTQQVDETAYAHFNVSVVTREIIDWRGLGDEWRNNLQNAIRSVSDVLSGVLFGLPVLLVWIVFWALGAGISILAAVVFAKYMWMWVVKVWRM
jgi:hypothetical protein